MNSPRLKSFGSRSSLSNNASKANSVMIKASAAEYLAILQRAGVNTDDLLITQPDSGETALEIVDQMVRSSAADIIVIDSVAALVPRAELEGEIGDKQSKGTPSTSNLPAALIQQGICTQT